MFSIASTIVTGLGLLTLVSSRAIGETRNMDTSFQLNTTTTSIARRGDWIYVIDNGTMHEEYLSDPLMAELAPVWIACALLLLCCSVLLLAVMFTNWLCCGPVFFRSRCNTSEDEDTEANNLEAHVAEVTTPEGDSSQVKLANGQTTESKLTENEIRAYIAARVARDFGL
ncbi:hypothetical protein E8E14_012905 [Neopestalotiopsis sp. 37M]|nr:hypothetical protein E8E14_012905 [Neopestalotiopsis sp. 37M]